MNSEELREKTLEVGSGLIERFNFEKVHALMVINKWTYCSNREVVSIEELKYTCYQILATLADCERLSTRTGTGGFKLYRHAWDTSFELELLFSWECLSYTFPNL
jgi:hypothetical protein